MYSYIIRRLLLIIPTLLGIMVINFMVIQFVPGGPVEQMIAQITGEGIDATARVGGQAGAETQSSTESKTAAGKSVDGGTSRYRGAQGLPQETVEPLWDLSYASFVLGLPAPFVVFLVLGSRLRRLQEL